MKLFLLSSVTPLVLIVGPRLIAQTHTNAVVSVVAPHIVHVNASSPLRNRLGTGSEPVPLAELTQAWLDSHASNLGRRLGLQTDDYQLFFEEVVLLDSEGPCNVTLIANLHHNGRLSLKLFNVPAMEQLLLGVLQDESEMESRGKTCLSVLIAPNGFGRLQVVQTQFGSNKSLCGCFSRGKSLVQLADLLACKFDQQMIRLEENSQLHCPQAPEVRAPMAFYYALKTGQSWYQSFGYQYDNQHVADLLQNMVHVGQLPLDWASSRLRPLLSLYQAHLGGQTEQVNRDFAFWVWQNHCSEWPLAVEAIFGDSSSMIWLQLNGPMAKPLVCHGADCVGKKRRREE